MYRSCSVCGRIHPEDKMCKRVYRKNTKESQFRNTNAWIKKRNEIKKRDKYLCQACINGYEATPFMFNYKDLQVHHIVSIDEDYSKRLDSTNLITLCPMHHKKAEQGIITKEELLKIIESQ